jgi:hypothetical protein
MPLARGTRAAALGLALLASPAAARAADFAEEPIAAQGKFERDVRVIDAATRRPIAGARIRRYGEMTEPMALFLGTFRAGADGVARIDTGDWTSESQWLLDAPGYATLHEYGVLPWSEEQELTAPRDVVVTLLDGLGRPLSGALLDGFDGCGHAPSMQVVTADAAGRATLRGIDPSKILLWPTAAGARSDYLDLRDRARLDGRTGGWVVVLEPGGVCEGIVEDGDGRPLQNVTMHVSGNDRGPNAMTGPDGRFRLVGGGEGDELSLCHPLADEGTWLRHHDAAWRTGFPLRLQLTRTGLIWDDESRGSPADEPDAPRRAVRIDVVTADGAAAPDVVTFVRKADGRAFDVDLPQDEPIDDLLPLGRYAVLDDARAPRRIVAAEVEIAAGEGAQTILVKTRELAALRVEGAVPEGAKLTLALPWRSEELDAVPDPDAPPPAIEPDAPAAVRVEWLSAAFFFEVGPEKDGVRTAKVALPQPHVLRVKRADGSAPSLRGRHALSDARDLQRDGLPLPAKADGATLRTFVAGPVTAVVLDDGVRHEIPVVLPPGGGKVLDLVLPTAEEAARRRVEVRIDDPDAARGAEITVWDRWGDEILDGEDYDPQSPPSFLLHGPVTVEVTSPRRPTRLVPVAEAGVVQVTWGTASVRIAAQSADGTPAERVRIGGDVFSTDDVGRVEIAGLDPGPLTIDVLLEERCAGVRLRTVLATGERAERKVVLPDPPADPKEAEEKPEEDGDPEDSGKSGD